MIVSNSGGKSLEFHRQRVIHSLISGSGKSKTYTHSLWNLCSAHAYLTAHQREMSFSLIQRFLCRGERRILLDVYMPRYIRLGIYDQ